MDTILVDFRDALRGLRRDPLYAAAIVATLALTLGASTAVFSIVNGVLLRPLAYPEAHRLVSMREVEARIATQYPSLPVNARHFEEWRTRRTVIRVPRATRVEDDEPDRGGGARATAGDPGLGHVVRRPAHADRARTAARARR